MKSVVLVYGGITFCKEWVEFEFVILEGDDSFFNIGGSPSFGIPISILAKRSSKFGDSLWASISFNLIETNFFSKNNKGKFNLMFDLIKFHTNKGFPFPYKTKSSSET